MMRQSGHAPRSTGAWVARQAPSLGGIVLVIGAKGGVGATTVALELARRGNAVAVDLALRGYLCQAVNGKDDFAGVTVLAVRGLEPVQETGHAVDP